MNNRKLLLAVNDRISDLYIELKEDQNDIAATVLMARQAIVAFYKKYQDEILAQDKRISRIEEYEKKRCPKCQNEMLPWQRICPYCGYIHPLKSDVSSEKTKQILSQISEIVKDEKIIGRYCMGFNSKENERVLRKAKTLLK